MSKTMIEEPDELMKLFLEDQEKENPIEKEVTEEKSVDTKKTKTKDTEDDDEDLKSLFEKQLNGEEDEDVKEDTTKKVDINETDESDSTDTETEDITYDFKALASYLSSEGAIDFEDSEEIENTPELIKEAVTKTAINMVNEYKESLPDVVQDLVSYIEKGGKPEQYLQALQKDIDFENIDLDNVVNQKSVVGEYLKLQGYTPDEIKESLQDFEDGLMLEKQAKIATKKLEKYYEGRAAKLQEEQEVYQQELVKAQTKEVEDIKKIIKSSKDIAGLPISDVQKDVFIKYLLQPDKTGKTGYQKETEADPVQTAIELAFVKFNKYDWTKATKEAKKVVNEELKKAFKQSETTVKGQTHQPPAKQKENDFSSFGKVFGQNKNK